MSVRKVVTRSGGHSRGLMPSIKNAIAAAWESRNELRFCQLSELSSLIHSYVVQPAREVIEVDGKPAIYIPDVEVKFCDGTSAFVEVKPAIKCKTAHVAKRLISIKKHFEESGRQFFLVTDEWLNQEPRQSNVARLMYHRREMLLDRAERMRLASLITANQPKTISDLIGLVGNEKAWLLLGLAIIGVDLERPMNGDSSIFLEGGHRHAHFRP